MALNTTGPISLAGAATGQSVEIELGGIGTTTITLNDSIVRDLLGAVSGPISLLQAYGRAYLIPINYLIVGGGGGATIGGGGGGGGVLTGSTNLSRGITYSITVGVGGIGHTNGSNSTFLGFVATGGGAGATVSAAALTGGSGGGGYFVNPAGTGIVGQGNVGGFGAAAGGSGGGGGGAGGAGSSTTDSFSGGAGGPGIISSITGTAIYYGAGGGGYGGGTGGSSGTGGAGGTNTGGHGGNAIDGGVTSPIANTGGGGGGSGIQPSVGASGIVVISYPIVHGVALTPIGSYIQTTVGSNYVYTFTGAGSILI